MKLFNFLLLYIFDIRDALYLVFCELNQNNYIQFHHFLLMMLEYQPRMREWSQYYHSASFVLVVH